MNDRDSSSINICLMVKRDGQICLVNQTWQKKQQQQNNTLVHPQSFPAFLTNHFLYYWPNISLWWPFWCWCMGDDHFDTITTPADMMANYQVCDNYASIVDEHRAKGSQTNWPVGDLCTFDETVISSVVVIKTTDIGSYIWATTTVGSIEQWSIPAWNVRPDSKPVPENSFR